jgi:hypothetical protein
VIFIGLMMMCFSLRGQVTINETGHNSFEKLIYSLQSSQTNSFEQYTSFICEMLGAKSGAIFTEEEKEQYRNAKGFKKKKPDP